MLGRKLLAYMLALSFLISGLVALSSSVNATTPLSYPYLETFENGSTTFTLETSYHHSATHAAQIPSTAAFQYFYNGTYQLPDDGCVFQFWLYMQDVGSQFTLDLGAQVAGVHYETGPHLIFNNANGTIYSTNGGVGVANYVNTGLATVQGRWFKVQIDMYNNYRDFDLSVDGSSFVTDLVAKAEIAGVYGLYDPNEFGYSGNPSVGFTTNRTYIDDLFIGDSFNNAPHWSPTFTSTPPAYYNRSAAVRYQVTVNESDAIVTYINAPAWLYGSHNGTTMANHWLNGTAPNVNATYHIRIMAVSQAGGDAALQTFDLVMWPSGGGGGGTIDFGISPGLILLALLIAVSVGFAFFYYSMKRKG